MKDKTEQLIKKLIELMGKENRCEEDAHADFLKSKNNFKIVISTVSNECGMSLECKINGDAVSIKDMEKMTSKKVKKVLAKMLCSDDKPISKLDASRVEHLIMMTEAYKSLNIESSRVMMKVQSLFVD